MKESYEIETIEQLRAIADVLRVRILDLLRERPMTVTQVGEALHESPAKVHYHVRELERVGLLLLVETREKGGILEKYYQPVARELNVSPRLFTGPSDEVTAALSGWFNQIKDGFLRALRAAFGPKEGPEPSEQEQRERLQRFGFSFSTVYLTPEERQALNKRIAELFKPYESRRGTEGEEELLVMLLIYPQEVTASTQLSSSVRPPESAWAVGAMGYSRADLEKVLAEGRRLDINAVGTCHFASDVSAELADRAIERFHIVGKLKAPAEVREVLLKKQAQRDLPPV
ncbi:MAG: winged helix-turn-helix domain-containing protein [Chloroflexota bacterium]|nr:winged helix-turn-helix domain-containing protein [Chloroflexota bacterium]